MCLKTIDLCIIDYQLSLTFRRAVVGIASLYFLLVFSSVSNPLLNADQSMLIIDLFMEGPVGLP